jgi:hypothetical protein
MTELIPTINEIIKHGLQANLVETDKEKLLERNLVKIYNLYFDIEFEFDKTDFPDFDKSKLPNIRENVESNFKDFGLYKLVIDINDLDNLKENSISDAVDDLTDIIIDLLEIKWRAETNSFADGLWYFKLVFYSHTQQHILNLLNFIKNKSF